MDNAPTYIQPRYKYIIGIAALDCWAAELNRNARQTPLVDMYEVFTERAIPRE